VNGQSLVGKPGWNANGTMASLNITDPFNTSDTQNCTYVHDDLVRLANVNCPAAWTQTFTYDVFGNITKGGSFNWNPGYNSSTNRYSLAGTSYDNNGNLLNDTFHNYQYDADGNIVALDVGGPNYTDYLTYDAMGNIAEYKQTYANGSPTWLAQLVYGAQTGGHDPLGWTVAGGGNSFEIPLVGGTRLDMWNNGGSPTTVYGHADWLGSIRLNSTPSRTVNDDTAFAPFGEVYISSPSWWHKFAGLAGKLTDGLWDADVRYYHAKQGRWTTPDPAGLAAVDPTDPQSWNRYAYVDNSPLIYTDPTGMNKCFWQGNRTPVPCAGGGYASVGISGWFWIPADQVITDAAIPNPDTGGITIYIGLSSDPGFYIYLDGGSGGGGNSSWAWTITKNFVSNFFSPSFYKQELQQGGCLNTFVHATGNALVPSLLPSVSTTAAAATVVVSDTLRYNAAQAYAASRTNVLGGQGLIFPQKSIPYNNILKGSTVRNLAEGGWGYVDGALFQGLMGEAEAAYNGNCH
jgi:RHS repeat-associated protein